MTTITKPPEMDKGVVRFLRGGHAVGAGLWLGDGFILTCAHVVNYALGYREGHQPQPAEAVQLDFPFLPGEPCTAQVIHWWPIEADERGDVAVLRLSEPSPLGAKAIPLMTAPDLWGHPCATYGFLQSNSRGIWVQGKLSGNIGPTGWIQLQGQEPSDNFVQRGFSGGPVWDEQLGGVVGINVYAEAISKKTAYIIPTALLQELWPDVARYIQPPTDDPIMQPEQQWLHQKYLRRLQAEVNQISNLTHIDPKAAERQMELAQLYTALLTLSSEGRGEAGLDRLERQPPEKPKPIAALEQLNRHQKLVLIGDPGSGKSTFVDFAVMCMAGALLADPQVNLDLLRTPLPNDDDDDDKDEPSLQPWDHGALWPIKVVLRKFAAEGLPPPDQKANAESLWAYLDEQLAAEGLTAYHPILEGHFAQQGGLLLFDGLDEVAEPEQRIPQLKQVIEDVALCYPHCRIVVTSRPYAYQNSAWHLRGFQQTTLAPFSSGQIRQFIQRWYGYLGYMYQWDEAARDHRARRLAQAIFSPQRKLLTLAQKPLLLTLMVNLHASKGSLPDKRAVLYEQTVELLLERWELGRLKADQSVITPRLSDWLEVSQEAVRQLLESLAYQAHLSQPAQAEGTANLDGEQLLNGLLDLTEKSIYPQELLEYLDQRAGILQSQGGRVYRFPHRTFQEYLATCYLNRLEDFPDELAELVRHDVNRWREVALLAAASNPPSMVWNIVDCLCDQPVPDTGAEPTDMYAALIAGEAIRETTQLDKLGKRGSRLLPRVRGWLRAMTTSDLLPVGERVNTGRLLGQLGDDRPGVGEVTV